MVIFDKQKQNILFCKRVKEPYKGLYNFPGGKAEPGENSLSAAYRELEEETEIGRNKIRLAHFMDLTYYAQEFVLELYVGQLHEEVSLLVELNTLSWMPLTEAFADSNKYAGDQNTAHIVNVALKYPLDQERENIMNEKCRSLGIDGCKGGWIVADITYAQLEVRRFGSLEEIVDKLPFDSCIIDMIIGLQVTDTDARPDPLARREIKGRSSTIFPAPCRKSVYGATKEERLESNAEILGKKLTIQTDAIIPKIREVDEFLQCNPRYKNVIEESNPEVCFARLNGEVLMTSKHTEEGIRERASVLSKFIDGATYEDIKELTLKMKCNLDDVTDAICLAIVGNLKSLKRIETIPENPMKDETGLLMQMVVPKRND